MAPANGPGGASGAGWGEVRALLQFAVPHLSLASPGLGRLPAGEAAEGLVMATTQRRDLAFYAAAAALVLHWELAAIPEFSGYFWENS